MKNKMKKSVVKILTVIFCMVTVFTTTILPAFAAYNPDVYDSDSLEEYPYMEIVLDRENSVNIPNIANAYNDVIYGDGVEISIDWEFEELEYYTCLCCNIQHEASYVGFGDGSGYFGVFSNCYTYEGGTTWEMFVDNGEIGFRFKYDSYGYALEDYPKADTDPNEYYYMLVMFRYNEARYGYGRVLTRGLGTGEDMSYHIFELSGYVMSDQQFVLRHYNTGRTPTIDSDCISYLEDLGVIDVSHPYHEAMVSNGAPSYSDGYNNGYDAGYDDGYDAGYSDCEQEYENSSNEEIDGWLQDAYDNGYSDGYDTGYAEGTADSSAASTAGIEQGVKQSKLESYRAFQILQGKNPDDLTNIEAELAKDWTTIVGDHFLYGYTQGDEAGYTRGYDEGIKESGEYSTAFKDMAFAIFEAPVVLVDGMLGFDLFGINLAAFFKTIITVAVIAAIVTVLVKFIL
ncbi:MAG: hypothetical protein IJX28_09080 [Clostridia bacterium]|nr:hypothetical protein [Clostridia bacterium]